MSTPSRPRLQFNDRTLFGPGSPGEWAQAMVLAVVISAVVAFASTLLGFAEFDYLVGAVVVIGGAVAILFVFGPPQLMLGVFLVLMILDHQFRSPFILPFGGVEWHPRELLLLLLMAHFGARLVMGRGDVRADVMHYFVLLYIVFFAHIAAQGVLNQADMHRIIAECRYPIFLGSYFVFVACTSSAKELQFYVRLVFFLSILIALAGCMFFLYTLLLGATINDQNVLGEYVQRRIGPFLLQSVRPNGHLFFEVCTVVLISLLVCPEESAKRKMIYLPIVGLFLFAIVITMMRTAYASFAASLLVLAVLFLPRELQVLGGFLAAVFLAAVFVLFSLGYMGPVLDLIPSIGVSLRGRLVEIEGGFRVFRQNPLLGAGMGSTFTGMGFVAKKTLLSVAQVEYQTVHNVWIYYLFKGGLVGMLLVGLGLGGVASRGHAIVGQLHSKRDQYFMRGMLAALVGQLIASLAMPRLTYPSGGVFLAMMAAAFVVMARERGGAEAAPEEGPSTPSPLISGP